MLFIFFKNKGIYYSIYNRFQNTLFKGFFFEFLKERGMED